MTDPNKTTNDNAIELRAFRRPDGTIYITSPTWPGFRYLLSGGEGLHEAIEMFGEIMQQVKQP